MYQKSHPLVVPLQQTHPAFMQLITEPLRMPCYTVCDPAKVNPCFWEHICPGDGRIKVKVNPKDKNAPEGASRKPTMPNNFTLPPGWTTDEQLKKVSGQVLKRYIPPGMMKTE